MLRPLARHFARQAGGKWARLADQVTCAIDISNHPGNQYIRTESISRMEKLTGMGWSPSQAAEAENLNLPKPEGQPKPAAAPAPMAPGEGEPGKPRRPVGDGGTEPDEPGPTETPAGRVITIREWLGGRRRAGGEDSPPAEDAPVLVDRPV